MSSVQASRDAEPKENAAEADAAAADAAAAVPAAMPADVAEAVVTGGPDAAGGDIYRVDAPPKRSREVMFVLPGLMLAFLLAMLDNFIVGTAMPRIVSDLGGLSHLSWVVTAYVLGTTVSTPIWGKIGDMYGRKGIFIASIVGFLAGSALSGAAHSMTQLIAFRAIQGLFAGGLAVNALAIIGDLVPPRERGRYQGIMASVMSIAMVGGPLIGGYITDNLDWRWAFYVNLPLGAIALVFIWTRLHLPKRRTEHRIDWFGAGVLAVAITALVLITTWGGTQYPWNSGHIYVLIAIAIVALVTFLVVEPKAAEPVIPLGLFRNRNFSLISIIGFLVGFGMFGAISFLPLFQQKVQGASATNSGLLLLPMMGGLLVTSLIAGQAITRTGRYKMFPILGGIGMVAGMALLSTMDDHTSKTFTSLAMVVLGLGMGLLMQTTTLIAQNSVEQKDMGVASSASTFFRSIGGSFGVALAGAILNNRMLADLIKSMGSQKAHKFMQDGAATATPPGVKMPPHVTAALADGVAQVFFWSIFISVLVPVLAIFIKHIALRGRAQAPARDGADAEAETAPVMIASE
jgi:EmrB/QacA subfamily drug resistance transporter